MPKNAQPDWLTELDDIYPRFQRDGLTPAIIEIFQTTIWNYYQQYGRSFPWRETHDPYRIMLSEIMLQQTQASRVVTKYEEFLEQFPTAEALAKSSTPALLTAWQGLGYNRRALNIRRAIQIIQEERTGNFPKSIEEWQALPGIGPYTAAAICAFAYNLPTVVIETNIRRLYIRTFFPESEDVHDRELLPLIAATLPADEARLWYYALMDIGHELPKVVRNSNLQSRHYVRQSVFKGSHRQLRGRILKLLLANGHQTIVQLAAHLVLESSQLNETLQELQQEGFLLVDNDGAELLH